MIYEFLDRQGRRVEEAMPMSEAPPIGSEICIEGRTLRRVPSLPPKTHVESDGGFVAHSRPDFWKYAERHDHDPASETYGSPIFKNRGEARTAAKRARDAGEDVHYDG